MNVSTWLKASCTIFAFPMEMDFHPQEAVTFTANHWHIPISFLILYVLFIHYGSKIMAHQKSFDLRIPLACWNAFLCLFSFYGVCRTVPYLLATLIESSFESSICNTPYETWGSGPTGFSVMVFAYSKIPELLDTVFIVLRKQSLIFLHWYHHVTVLLFCWSAYSTLAGTGLYFVAMNYSVH
eukprot:gene2308-3115_t